MEIELFNAANTSIWNEFVAEAEDIEFFFTLEWKNIIEKAFNLKPFYYLIRENGEIVAIVPFFLIVSSVFGNRLISLPFTDYGGVYFKRKVDVSSQNSIIKFLLEEISIVVKHFRIGYIEIRGCWYEEYALGRINCFSKSPYVRFSLNLNRSFNGIISKFSKSIRRVIKKNQDRMENEKVKIFRCQEKKDLNKIYSIYLRDMRRFGSPPLPRSYFEAEWDILKKKNMLEIFTAYYKDTIIGSISLLIFKKKIYAELIMSNTMFDWLCPKIILLYETIKWAQHNGFYSYDFGRTRRDTGVYEHKKRWGGEESNINYSFIVYNQKCDTRLDFAQSKFSMSRKLIKNLPLCFLETIGPIIRKNIGK